MRISLILAALALASPTMAQGMDGEPFRIFFDWGKPELTRDAQSVLDEVAAAYRQAPDSRIALAGHADRSGPAAHNVGASRRRAESARDGLVARGVPAEAITIVAHGESHPIIATEDGVREAQNRRVEIRLVPGN